MANFCETCGSELLEKYEQWIKLPLWIRIGVLFNHPKKYDKRSGKPTLLLIQYCPKFGFLRNNHTFEGQITDYKEPQGSEEQGAGNG